MVYVWLLSGFVRGYCYLHTARITDPAVHKPDSLEHGLYEGQLLLKRSVNHLLPGVPMREITVESELGKFANKLYSPPHVLKQSGSVRFRIKRHTMSV